MTRSSAGDAVRILGELGSTEGILARAAAELGLASQLEPILISEVTGASLAPLATGTAPATAIERQGRTRSSSHIR